MRGWALAACAARMRERLAIRDVRLKYAMPMNDYGGLLLTFLRGTRLHRSSDGSGQRVITIQLLN